MMIYKCIVILLILLPSLGLAQIPPPTNQFKEQQTQIEYLNQIIGIALDYTPSSLRLHDFIFDWIGKPYRFGGESKKGIVEFEDSSDKTFIMYIDDEPKCEFTVHEDGLIGVTDLNGEFFENKQLEVKYVTMMLEQASMDVNGDEYKIKAQFIN